MAEMLSTTGQSREQLASQMKHLHTLWRNAKLKLMEKDEELDDAKDRIKTLEKAQEGHVSKISALMTVKELSVELQTRHSFATSQLEQMREENEAMRTELRMANSERDAAVSAEREATAQLKAMKSRAERAEEELRAFERRVEETERNHRLERSQREHAHQRLEMQETHTQRIHREKNELEVEVATLGKMVETLRKDLDKTSSRNGELEEEMGALRDTSWREKLLLSEIESMKLDMGRLIRLLSSTAEYREFRHLWEDSGGKPAPGSGIAGAAYLPPHGVRGADGRPAVDAMRLDVGAHGGGMIDTLPPRAAWEEDPTEQEWSEMQVLSDSYPTNHEPTDDPRGEGDAWVPRETLSAAKEFHARMMPHSSFEPIVGFLRAMNKAWRRREMRHCERLRAAFQDRLDEVVRKTQHDQPMEVVRKNAEIARLKKQLSDARYASLHSKSKKKASERGRMPPDRRRTLEKMSMALSKDQLLEASLHTVEKLSKEIVKHSPTRGKGAGGGYGGAHAVAGSAPFLAGAEWFGRSAVLLADGVGDEILGRVRHAAEEASGVRDDTVLAVQALKPGNPDERVQRLVDIDEALGADVERALTASRLRLRQLFEAVVKTEPGDATAFERLESAMPAHDS